MKRMRRSVPATAVIIPDLGEVRPNPRCRNNCFVKATYPRHYRDSSRLNSQNQSKQTPPNIHGLRSWYQPPRNLLIMTLSWRVPPGRIVAFEVRHAYKTASRCPLYYRQPPLSYSHERHNATYFAFSFHWLISFLFKCTYTWSYGCSGVTSHSKINLGTKNEAPPGKPQQDASLSCHAHAPQSSPDVGKHCIAHFLIIDILSFAPAIVNLHHAKVIRQTREEWSFGHGKFVHFHGYG